AAAAAFTPAQRRRRLQPPPVRSTPPEVTARLAATGRHPPKDAIMATGCAVPS
ncbi:unnamed protein product, partial [Urochloa humidicola]